MNKKIVFIIPYFGKIPQYFSFFLESCYKNKFIDFLVFTNDDTYHKNKSGSNVTLIKMTLNELNQLVSEKTDTNFSLNKPYKLCDLKPMYGKIFEDYIKNYDFWGFTDIDILLGDLQKIITDELTNVYDVISFYSSFISGPICILRNEPHINNLFFKSKDYEKILQLDHNFYFDEAGGIEVIRQLWKGIPIEATDAPIESFTHLVLNKEKGPENVYLKTIIVDRELENGEQVNWTNGKLMLNNEEIFVYHFFWNKGNITFNVPKYIAGNNFHFTKNGFFYDTMKSKTIDWANATINNFSSKAIKKLRSL